MPIDNATRDAYFKQFEAFRARCDKWYGLNQGLKNGLFLVGVITGAFTLIAGIFFDGQVLKITVALLGLTSTIIAACQKYMRSGAKAEFYSAASNEMQEILAYLPLARDEDEIRSYLARYANLLKKESELAKDVDPEAIKSGTISDLREWLNKQPGTKEQSAGIASGH